MVMLEVIVVFGLYLGHIVDFWLVFIGVVLGLHWGIARFSLKVSWCKSEVHEMLMQSMFLNRGLGR